MMVTFYASRDQYFNHVNAVREAYFAHTGMPTFSVFGSKNLDYITDNLVVVASRKDARALAKFPDVKVVLMQHGAGQNYGHAERTRDWAEPNENVALYLAPNERTANRNRDIFPNATIKVVSSPWVEKLWEIRTGKRGGEVPLPDTLVFTWHWNGSITPEAGSAHHHFKSEILDVAKKVWPGPIVGTAHPRMMRYIEGWYGNNGIKVVEDFAKLIPRMKVLVADNTSAIWEACALDIPVVLMHSPYYRRNVSLWPRFYAHADIGYQIEDAMSLETALQDGYYDTGFVKERKKATDAIYGDFHGAGVRAANAIDNLAHKLFRN